MTRKRFIKLVMAEGKQKREAEALAYISLSTKGNYQKYYDRFIWTFRLNRQYERMKKGIIAAGNEFAKAGKAIIDRLTGGFRA